jgi:hypothetical protein
MTYTLEQLSEMVAPLNILNQSDKKADLMSEHDCKLADKGYCSACAEILKN